MSVRPVPFGKYHLLERVNVGGMAEVYRAKMVGVEGFEKQLAIKRILPAIAADQDFINMFIDEAKISVQLAHANIAQIFELGRINDTYYIALEYLAGKDLRALFERLRRRREIVPVELACYVISRVAEGLDYAHRKRDAQGRELGIIHRDISPQNILVSFEGEVKVIDFGIAKAANKIMKTQAGILKGKFGYMSPEQVRGLPLDRRSDIFACGIVLYELLTGDRLFTGDSDYSILEKVRAAQVPRVSTVRQALPPAIDPIVARALARDPDERYQHASELVADLQRYMLTQERPFTREDLAAYMKSMFAEEWEREKRQAHEPADDDEPTPLSDPGGSVPLIRAPSRQEDTARRAVEVPPGRPPLPPVDDEPPAPSARRARPSRLAAAAQAAETERAHVGPAIGAGDEHDETTTTESEPRLLPRRPPPRPPITQQETRVQRVPPPVASRPPPPRSAPSMPPGPVRMPTAITDNLPQVRRAPPPVFSLDSDEDEPTVLDASGRTGQALRAAGAIGGPIGSDVAERDTHADGAGAYKPRKRTNWTIVPVAVVVALGAGFIGLQLTAPEPVAVMDKVGDALADPNIDYAKLVVLTEPVDAEVVVDGAVVKAGGTQPFVTERMQTGVEHVVVVRKEGFRDNTSRVTLARGESRELAISLIARSAVLNVTSTPSGARVFVDGQDMGKTPAALATLSPGHYTVRAELKCFQAAETRVKLGSFDRSVALDLKPLPGACVANARPSPASSTPGRLRLMSRPPAQVFIDGVDTGRRTPLIDYPLPPGKHVVRLVTDGQSSQELEVDIEPGRPFTRHVVIGGR